MPIGDYSLTNTVSSLIAPNTAGSFYVDSGAGTNITGTITTSSTYWPWYHADNRMQTAFKIVKHLMDKKLVSLETIPQFVELIDELITIL